MDYVDVEYYLPETWTAGATEAWLYRRASENGKRELSTLIETSIVFPLRFHLTIRTRFL
jgi:hypothetical protein